MAAQMPREQTLAAVPALDKIITPSWEHVCAIPGVLRNDKYRDTRRRRIGPSEVIIQYNPVHIQTKRPATATPVAHGEVRVVRPYNHAGFNFTKVKEAEKVAEVTVWEAEDDDKVTEMTLTFSAGTGTASNSAASAEPGCLKGARGVRSHPLFVNVNPLFDDHCLLVPFLDGQKPQVFTSDLMREVVLVASGFRNCPAWKFGFNSLSAWASVGHFHIQCGKAGELFGEDCLLPIERAERRLVATEEIEGGGRIVLEELGWACKGFVFTLEGGRQPSTGSTSGVVAGGFGLVPPIALDTFAADVISSTAGKFVDHLWSSNIPHQVVITNGGRRVFALPRIGQAGPGAEALELVVAVAEAMGIAIVYKDSDFEGFTEEQYQQALRDVKLGDDELKALEQVAKELIGAYSTGVKIIAPAPSPPLAIGATSSAEASPTNATSATAAASL
jgi:hypothetical protein